MGDKKKYLKYISSAQWKQIRSIIIEKRGGKCEQCGSKKKLQVHHLTYARLFKERDSDLKLLCKKCHFKLHKQKRRHWHRPRNNNRHQLVLIDELLDTIKRYGYSCSADMLLISRGNLPGTKAGKKAKRYVNSYIKRRCKKKRKKKKDKKLHTKTNGQNKVLRRRGDTTIVIEIK